MNSKHIVPIALLFSLGFTSCKKDKDETPSPSSPQPLEHPFLKVGNKWVYEMIYVDEKGKETFVGLDSTYIETDTLIKETKWYKSISIGRDGFRRTPIVVLYRDSAGILINNLGDKVLEKYENRGVTSSKYYYRGVNIIDESHSFLKFDDTLVNVPAGVFKVRNIEILNKLHDQGGHFAIKYTYNWFSEDLGTSIYSTYFYTWPILAGIDEHYEKRLLRYIVQ